MPVDYVKLLTVLVKPLVVYPEDISVNILSEEELEINIQVLVNKEDLGRVIGKNGKIANAIRTICYASATKDNRKVNINFDTYE